MASGSVDITYRGIFQKSLAALMTKELVKAARVANKFGGTVQRYGDSPERNGIPAKQYAIITDHVEELPIEMTKYEPDNVKVICVMDDTLAKGVESWAWYGTQPININLNPDGTLLFISRRTPDALLKMVPRKNFSWNIAVLPGDASFAGLWVYRDDGTDYRTLGAVTKIAPELLDLETLVAYVSAGPDSERKLAQIREGHQSVVVRTVQPGEGIEDTYIPMEKPGWTEMREGVAINAVPVGQNNELFKKYSTRSSRPVVDFDQCIKCRLCFLECPDEIFGLTSVGHYEVNYEHCCGCGVCAEVCPVDHCITMVDELVFESNENLYELYERDSSQYKLYLDDKLKEAGVKSL